MAGDPRGGTAIGETTIGLVVPFAADQVPFEGPIMYPRARFVPKGVGVRALTPAGYESAFNGIIPAAEHLAAQGVEAIMVIGTSLTFYRGYDAHELLLERLRRVTGLPVSTMSEAIVDGLRAVGAREIAVCTAYSDEVNERLAMFLTMAGFEVLALQGFGLTEFGGPAQKSEDEIIALCDAVYGEAPQAGGSADFLRRPAHAWSRQADRRASWRAGRVVGDRSVLGGKKAAMSLVTGSCSSSPARR